MKYDLSPELVSLFGSRTRLLAMAVLSNAGRPFTGHRVALVPNLPREKVYPELRKAAATGLVTKTAQGFRMADPDVRALLSKRVRLSWEDDWDNARAGLGERTTEELAGILASLPSDPGFLRSNGWKPTRSARDTIKEMTRPPEKDRLLRERGLRTSEREDRDRGR
jgi:hypothetical protein